MAVDLGSAQGSLTLDAAAFFASVQSSINEIHALHDAAAQAASGVDTLEGSLSGADGAGAGLSGAMSGMSEAASVAATGVENVGDAATSAGTSTGTFRERLSSAFQTMRDSLPTAEELAAGLENFGNKAVSVGKDLTKYITTPLAGLGVYSVKTSMDFEKAMSQVAATMGVSVDEIDDLTEAAKKMGEETQFTNIEAAQALNYLALAGYNSEQMIAALPNVLNLAAAGGMDLASASDMLTDGLSALNLASKDSETLMGNMSTMVDQMARTASRSNTSVSQLGDSILTVGGTAAYLNGGLSEVNQVIGLLADRGIKAGEAGTHLRNIILAMQPATDDAKQAFLDVGLAMKDAEGNFINLAYNADGTMKPLQEVFKILQEGTATMTDMEKQQILGDIFHRTDLASANALLGTSQERWQELADEINNAAGAGSQMAATQLNNLSGQLTLLKSKLDSVATSIGEILSPVVTKILDKISSLLDKFKELDPETQEMIVNFGLIAAAVGPALTVIGKLAIGLGKLITVARTVGTVLSTAFSGLAGIMTTAVGTALAGVGAFLAGYGIGTMIYNAIGDEIDEVLHPIFDGVVEAWGVVVEFFTETIPDAFNTCMEFVTGVGSEIADTVSSAISSVVEFFTGIWNSIVETFSSIVTWVDENIIQPVLAIVVPIVTKIYEICAKIVEIVIALFGVLATWVYDNVIQPIMNSVTNAVSWVTSKFQALWDGITGIFSKIASWWTTNVSEPISNLMMGAAEWVSDKFSAAYDAITGVFSVIGEFFSGVWEDIKTALSDVGTWFTDTFQAAYDAIAEVFSGIKDFFVNVWDGIKETFSEAATFIADSINGAFAAAFNAAMTGVEDTINFFIDALNGVANIINKIPGVNIGKLDRLELPKLSVGLDYVPYDNYGALLHKGERVLTAEENQEYNSGRLGGGDTYIFNSPEPIDERTAAQEMKRVKQELAEGF